MEFIKKLQKIMEILGDVRLSEAVTWVEVKENAESLLAEGHEGDTPDGE